MIVNSIKSNSQKKKPQKCFKCLRVGHISKDCVYETSVFGQKIRNKKRKDKSPVYSSPKKRKNDEYSNSD